MKVIIIDDESLARQIVAEYCKKIDGIEIVAEVTNGFDAVKSINEQKPDLVFLDIQMPKLSGFEVIELIEHKCEIIFTTAYDQFALKTFEINAIDYLLKPFSFQRFLSAVEKAKEKISLNKNNTSIEKMISTSPSTLSFQRIVVKEGSRIIIIPTEKIIYFEAQDDYVMIHSELGKHLKQQRMKFYENNLPEKEFIRVHRSYIVKIEAIKEIQLIEKDSYLIKLINGKNICVSKTGYSKLKEFFK